LPTPNITTYAPIWLIITEPTSPEDNRVNVNNEESVVPQSNGQEDVSMMPTIDANNRSSIQAERHML
jgi:hypothetical protein